MTSRLLGSSKRNCRFCIKFNMVKNRQLRYNAIDLGRVETYNRKNFHIVMEILEQLRYNVLIGV